MKDFTPLEKFQALGRCRRAGSQVMIITSDDFMESRIAARLAEELKRDNLPVLVITDETVKQKGLPEELLYPFQKDYAERLTKQIMDELDKEKNSGSIPS